MFVQSLADLPTLQGLAAPVILICAHRHSNHLMALYCSRINARRMSLDDARIFDSMLRGSVNNEIHDG